MTKTVPTLTLDQARERLRKLGLYGLHEQVESILDEPWLQRVIEIEEHERAQRSLKRRLRDAKLGAFKPISDFDWNWPAKCDRALVEELYSLSFLADAANVFLIGPNGLGKTMLLKNFAHRAVLHGHTARFIFVLSRQSEPPYADCWMTDGVLIPPGGADQQDGDGQQM